ncbi:MAG: DUF2550 family protein, partial [Nocardioides sp.]
MPAWEWLLDSAAGILALVLVIGIALIVRRRALSRHGGTFELSYRAPPRRDRRGLLFGPGRSPGSSLQWFRVFSLTPRP